MDSSLFIAGLSVIIALLSMTIALSFYAKRGPQYTLVIILGMSFLLRLIPAQDPFLHEWDEQFHALVAKNLDKNIFKPTLYHYPVLDYDYQDWTSNHVWLHKQPLPLWLMHFSLKTFGNTVVALRLPSVLLSTCCIWLTFLIGNALFKNSKTALIAAYLHGVNGFIIANAVGRLPTDHIDCHFLFFTELSILFIVWYREFGKFWMLAMIGTTLGLAILCKWLTAGFVIPLFLLMLKPQKSWWILLGHCTLIVAISTIIALPWQFYIAQQFPQEAQWEQHYNFLHLFTALEGHTGAWYYHLAKARIIWNELVYLPFIALMVFAIRSRRAEYWFLLLWILIPYVFFSMVKTKMTAYVMISAPAIFISCAWFVEKLQSLKPKLGQVLLVLMLGLAIRYSVEKIKPFQEDLDGKNKLDLVKKIKLYDAEKHTVVFNFPHPLQAMFFTNCIAYSQLPTTTELRQLHARGYRLFIYQKEEIPAEYINQSEWGLIK